MKRSTCNQWLGRLTTLLMAFALSSAFIFAQTKTVTGTVVDELGEVVNNILSDLDLAIANLPSSNSKKLSSTHWLPTKYAAEALKARVALFAASWLGENSYYSVAKGLAITTPIRSTMSPRFRTMPRPVQAIRRAR